MTRQYDVAVVGAGIVGLAHAWMAARRGLRVVVFERTAVAEGASVRNFGMIWPIGQPAGQLYDVALRSRELWLELGRMGVLEVQECGSIHLAHREDELAVLEEFCTRGTHAARMITPQEIARQAPLANPRGLLGGMWSDTELRVNPRVACSRITSWLAEQFDVAFQFQTAVTKFDGTTVVASDGRSWGADRLLVCSGSDLRTLFPEFLEQSGLVPCKLQMLKSVAQSPGHRQAAHLASGLTLRHYKAFEACRALGDLKARIARETPELDRFGIHVMASQFPNGEVILGDSHEYGDEISPFDKTVIDELLLRELSKVFHLENWTIEERWHGVYVKHPTSPLVVAEAGEATHVVVGIGGAGMTLSFGMADGAWQSWMGSQHD